MTSTIDHKFTFSKFCVHSSLIIMPLIPVSIIQILRLYGIHFQMKINHNLLKLTFWQTMISHFIFQKHTEAFKSLRVHLDLYPQACYCLNTTTVYICIRNETNANKIWVSAAAHSTICELIFVNNLSDDIAHTHLKCMSSSSWYMIHETSTSRSICQYHGIYRHAVLGQPHSLLDSFSRHSVTLKLSNISKSLSIISFQYANQSVQNVSN